jgi:NhaA family Na+:H+ antiporter
MTIFFLVAGLEIRRELHEGALSDIRSAALPIVAAVGGVIAPAAVYLAFNWTANREGWAVPIATDIAFAVGVLALLGRSIPSGVRILLLALAIIDDIAAVLVIAIAFSSDLNWAASLIALAAIGIVLGMQRLGIRNAFAYVVPGVLLWFGLWRFGVHPTLAGVVLGLLTPASPLSERTQRDLVPPVVSVESALHGWVAYGIMPLFALANAGVSLGSSQHGSGESTSMLALGIGLGLLLGKPIGILAASAITIRFGWCALPNDVGWRGLILIAFLGAIGFTMSIFIAALAFADEALLASAKLAILMASGAAAVISLVLGRWLFGAKQSG